MKITNYLLSVSAVALICAQAWAAVPSGYYSSCEGKSQAALLEALEGVVGNHTTISYSGLWDLYKTSDVDENGKIWDMYSTKRWNPGSEQCGSYSNVGDCYNREHSMPKSWFSDASPMVSDAFHIYPTDGKVNGQRSNYPYGECAGGTSVSSSGGVQPLGKLGACTFSGYTGTVFEPDDEYKGDFARSYFYMAAAYNSKIGGWDSPMLAGNSYPAFTTWSVNLLLKWHRQDPVSDKERKRNEVIYNNQHNRNPFIDYPDMAEHIWGNATSTGWSASGTTDPQFVLPVAGSTIDLGTTGVGVQRTYSVRVQGTNFTGAVTASVSGAGFAVSPASLAASAVNASTGTTLLVKFTSSTVGSHSGTLTLTSGTASVSVDLSATVVSGIPALAATNVTEDSFTARWVNIDADDSTYSLALSRKDGIAVSGYPIDVLASDEEYAVTGLESGVTYIYTLSNGTLTSNAVEVTTASAIPSIQAGYSGELTFFTAPGVPSDSKEITLDIENIAEDVVATVSAPFQVSTDKATWTSTVTLVPGEDHFYLRLYGSNAGSFETVLRFTAGSYVNDDYTATGTISAAADLCETFESDNSANFGSYDGGDYTGAAANWTLANAGLWSSDTAYEGTYALRMGKTATSSITLNQNHSNGVGVVSFYARNWSASEGEVTASVDYSTDGGSTWTTAGTVTIPNGTTYAQYSVTVNQPTANRFRVAQSAGARWLLDNLAVTPYSASTGVLVEGLGDQADPWDAFCRGGVLIVENRSSVASFTVYTLDATAVSSFSAAVGETSVALPAGFYIVVSGDHAERVVVR